MAGARADPPQRFGARLALAVACASAACNVYTPDMVQGLGGMIATSKGTGGLAHSGSTTFGTGSAGGSVAAGGKSVALGGSDSTMGGTGGCCTTSNTGGATARTTAAGGTTYASQTASGGSQPANGGVAPVTAGRNGAGMAGVTQASGSAGSTSANSAGAAGTFGGTSSSAASVGGTGSAGAATCDPNIIDDMHDANAPIYFCDPNRVGSWYAFGTDPTLTPSVGSTFVKTPVGSAVETLIRAPYAAVLTGSGTQNGDCGMGFPLHDDRGTKLSYSLRGSKIRFWYKTTGITGSRTLWLAVPIIATTPVNEGGSCTVAADCSNHYAIALAPTNSTWMESPDVQFVAGTGGFSQDPTWGAHPPWDPDAALYVQFTVHNQVAGYSVSVGPIKFVP